MISLFLTLNSGFTYLKFTRLADILLAVAVPNEVFVLHVLHTADGQCEEGQTLLATFQLGDHLGDEVVGISAAVDGVVVVEFNCIAN